MGVMSGAVPLNSFESTTTVNSRAPLTSTSTSFDREDGSSPIGHDYESPLELQRELERERSRIRQDGHRKKQCLLYEPTNISNKTYDEESDGVRYIHAHDRLYRVIFALLFLFMLLSLCLSLMAILGIHLRETKCSCDGSSETAAPPPRASHSKASEGSVITAAVEKNVMQIQRNFSYLYSIVIPSLQSELKELRKMAEVKVDVSKMVGPRGPQGPVGPRGPQGIGNLTLCRHESSSVTSLITSTATDGNRRTVAVTPKIYTSKEKVITGVTCSCVGAAEYSLISSRADDGVETLFCRCGGKADSYALTSSDNSIHCTIHWWECPAIS